MGEKQESRAMAGFLLCLAGLVVSLLAGLASISYHQAQVRGIPAGLPQPVDDTTVAPLCINAALAQYEGETLDEALGRIAGAGFVWVRQTFPWAEIERAPGVYDWEPWDQLVDAATSRGLHVIAVLDTAPVWAGLPPPPAEFARFSAAFAERYGDRIDDYQLWHNANLVDGWGDQPNPVAYTELLRQAAQAIRAVDSLPTSPDAPGTRILLGSLAPTVEQGPENLSELLFLDGLYAAGAGPHFDVLTAQAYGFDTGPDDRRVHEWVLNFSRPILLREALVAQGEDRKAVWISHFGWNSPLQGSGSASSLWGRVDEQTQAAYTVAAIERARREWPWMGVLCLTTFQPAPDAPPSPSGIPNAEAHWGFAAVRPDGTPRPVLDAVARQTSGEPLNDPGAYTPLSGIATWQGAWEFSELGADVGEEGGDRVSIPFWGTDFGLRVRQGAYRGTFYITIDGQPASELPQDEQGRAYLVLTSPDYAPRTTMVPLATGLRAGRHTAVLVSERGWDQWPLVGWSVAYHPPDRAYQGTLVGLGLLSLAFLLGLIATVRRVRWGKLGQAARSLWERLSEGAQVLLTLSTTALLWLSAWMTWAVEAGDGFRRLGDGVGITATLAAAGLFYISPWFLLTLLAGALLFALTFLRLDLGLALIAALAPFYPLPRPLFDKAFSMAEIVTLMVLASWSIRQIAGWRERGRGRATIRANRLDVAVLFLVAVAAVSPFFAEFKTVAWRELRLVVLEPAALYLVLRTSRLERKALWRVADFFLLGGVAVAIIGLVQYALGTNLITAEGGLPRLRSIYGSPNNVGLYLGRVLPLALAVALFARHRWRRLAYGLVVLPLSAALALSFSKGALLLGMPAALLTMGLLAGGRWLWATLAAVIAAIGAAIPLLRLPRFASLFNTRQGTTFFRLKLWRATLSMIRDHPWLGVGLDNFLYYYRGRYILPDAWQEPDLSHPHNFVLDHWARLGIFGLAASIWLQVAFWRLALPLRRLEDADNRALALGLMGGMANLVAHGLVDHSFFLIDLAFTFFLFLGLAQALASGQAPNSPPLVQS